MSERLMSIGHLAGRLTMTERWLECALDFIDYDQEFRRGLRKCDESEALRIHQLLKDEGVCPLEGDLEL